MREKSSCRNVGAIDEAMRKVVPAYLLAQSSCSIDRADRSPPRFFPHQRTDIPDRGILDLFVDVFDNAGTLIGVTLPTGLMKDGKLARMKQALISDSFAAMFGALIGTSTTTSYIESAAGVSAGGRTGLTAAFVGLFSLLALFFAPLAGMVPAYASAAALLYVACVMTRGLAEIDWEDVTEYAPAVVTAITMPLTYSIATGIGLGFISYALVKIVSGKMREASPAVIVLAILFAAKFAVTG